MRRYGTAPVNSLDKHIGERVSALLHQSAITATDVANGLGMTLREFEDRRTGQARFTARQIFELSKLLNVGVSEFYRR